MAFYTKYDPYVCFAVLIIIIVVLVVYIRYQQYYDHNYMLWDDDQLPYVNKPAQIDNSPKIEDNYALDICINRDNYNIENFFPEKNKIVKNKFVSKGQYICQRAMEHWYGVPFKTIRPEWLVNPETKRRLELDCYNHDLKIAIEYNGVQHYKWPNQTGQSKEDFLKQVRRDQYKANVCRDKGVYLIVVPYNVKLMDIPAFIGEKLPEAVRNKQQLLL